jgi:hypothetical protein
LAAFEWSSEDWKKYKSKIIKKQNVLGDLGAVELVCKLLTHESNFELVTETLLFAIALLIGGNKLIQDKFAHFIKKDDEN